MENRWISFNLPLIISDSLLWTGHPDDSVDIAVSFFPSMDKNSILLSSVSKVKYIPRSDLAALDSVSICDEIVFFGFPLGIGSYSRPKPVVRFGAVSYINKEKGYILVDAQAFGGSSGSPVISTGQSKCGPDNRSGMGVIGIISAFEPSLLRFWSRKLSPNQPSNDSVAIIPIENSGLAKVYSSDLILETLEIHKKRMEPVLKRILDSMHIKSE